MSPEAQRIAIAEACGWEHLDAIRMFHVIHWFHRPTGEAREELPDYLSDLNAMHEVEKVLTPEQLLRYIDELVIVTKAYNYQSVMIAMHTVARATSSQRAEAFLRTIGKFSSNVSAQI